jgi:hypothetical protein
MQNRASAIAFAGCLLALSLAQCSKPGNTTNENRSATAESGKTAADTTIHDEKGKKLVAYYLHGTFRCPTCLSIERQSKETIETEFADLIAAGTVVFQSLNYDEPENAHFIGDYEIGAPSLVLSLRNGGKEVAWKNLSEVWNHAHDPAALRGYVAGEIEKTLTEM